MLTLSNALGLAVGSIASFLLYFGYDVAFEVLGGGRTPGKRLAGLRVLRDDGRPVDLLSSCIRNVIRLVDGLPLLYLPAMVSILVTTNNQRLGDLAARTIVVRDPKATKNAEARSPRRARGAGAAAARPAPAAVRRPAAGRCPPARRSRAAPTARSTSPPSRPRTSPRSARSWTAAGSCPPGPRGDIARRIAGALQPRVGGATGHLTTRT